jgi:hypothetical protein
MAGAVWSDQVNRWSFPCIMPTKKKGISATQRLAVILFN